MTEPTPKIRLYVDAPLGPDAAVDLDRGQAHYTVSVMRRGVGDRIGLFNGADGEWAAEIVAATRRTARLICRAQTRAQRRPPDLWLVFAPVKKARTDFIVEKATELGVRRLVPAFTRHTQAERLRPERLRAIAIEAAEQCGETHLPDIAPPRPLAALLDTWPAGRRVMVCDERMTAPPAAAALAAAAPGPWAIVIGPEGGFAPDEAARLAALPGAVPVTLGPRILRADTAAVAAIALWQAALGDWR